MLSWPLHSAHVASVPLPFPPAGKAEILMTVGPLWRCFGTGVPWPRPATAEADRPACGCFAPEPAWPVAAEATLVIDRAATVAAVAMVRILIRVDIPVPPGETSID